MDPGRSFGLEELIEQGPRINKKFKIIDKYFELDSAPKITVTGELINDLISRYMYARDSLIYFAEHSIKEFLPTAKENVSVGEFLYKIGLWKELDNPFVKKTIIKKAKDYGLNVKVSNEIIWNGTAKEIDDYINFLDEISYITPDYTKVKVETDDPELIPLVNENYMENEEVVKEIDDFIRKNGFNAEVDGKQIIFYGDEKELRKMSEKLNNKFGAIPTVKASLKEGGSFVENKVYSENELWLKNINKGKWLKRAAIALSVGSLLGMVGTAAMNTSSHVNYYDLNTALRSWSALNNTTKESMWAHFIFHDLNSTYPDNSTAIVENISWLNTNNTAFMEYFMGNFTDDNGNPIYLNETAFNAFYQLVNNATNNINGKNLARMIAGQKSFTANTEGGTPPAGWSLKVPGWGYIDPIEFKTMPKLLKIDPRLANYGNLTMILSEMNATHGAITPQVKQIIKSTVDVWENMSKMEQLYMYVEMHPTNKSFQYYTYDFGGGAVIYYLKKVNDTADFYYNLMTNKTIRSVLGDNYSANRTIMWLAGTFGKFLVKGSWNGPWPDEYVMRLAVNWTEFMGKWIENGLKLPNSMIAIRKYPVILGSYTPTFTNTNDFNNTFLDPYRPIHVNVNGTKYTVNGLLKAVYDYYWGPNAVDNLTNQLVGKNISTVVYTLFDLINKASNGKVPTQYNPGNLTGLTKLFIYYKLDNDGNPDNDVKVPIACGNESDYGALVAQASPLVIGEDGLAHLPGSKGVPLSALITSLPLYTHQDMYSSYIDENGTPELYFDMIGSPLNLTYVMLNKTGGAWQTPQISYVKLYGPNEIGISTAPYNVGDEGQGPSWRWQIPPGRNASTYKNPLNYQLNMLYGTSNVYNLEAMIREVMKPILQKYDLYNMNITNDHKINGYPNISSVPELSSYSAIAAVATALGVATYLKRRKEEINES